MVHANANFVMMGQDSNVLASGLMMKEKFRLVAFYIYHDPNINCIGIFQGKFSKDFRAVTKMMRESISVRHNFNLAQFSLN